MKQQDSPKSAQKDVVDSTIPSLPQQIQAKIQGEISGQVVVGSHILQIGSIHGGVVNINSSEQLHLKTRSLPVLLRPRPFSNLIGREEEVKTAIEVLQSFVSVELRGEEGIGKTSILRHLAHRPEIALLFPDGIVYLSARSKSASDLLQFLFDAFYDSNTSIKPTDLQVRYALQDKRAMILLDDTKLTRNELEELMDIMPNSTFLLSSQEQQLWCEGKSIILQGLSTEKAIALIESNLGRSLELEEKSATKVLCNILNGHPLKLLQCLSTIKQGTVSLTEIAHQYHLASKPKQLPEIIGFSIHSKEERYVLAVLATLGGAGLLAQQIAAITQLPDTKEVLQTLHERNLIEFDGERYSISYSVSKVLIRCWNSKSWLKKVLDYFTDFTEQCKATPHRILEEADAILQLLTEAATVGLWSEILRLGPLVEKLFALNKYWGFWEKVLKLGLQAARQTGQKVLEAFMLHQIGTRATCLNDKDTAQDALRQAIQIRESIGDRVGATISRHNLRILLAITAGSAAVVIGAAQTKAATAITSTVSSAGNLTATVGKTGSFAAGATSTSFGTATLLQIGATVAVLSAGTIITTTLVDPNQPDISAPPTPSPTVTVSPPPQPQTINRQPQPSNQQSQPSDQQSQPNNQQQPQSTNQQQPQPSNQQSQPSDQQSQPNNQQQPQSTNQQQPQPSNQQSRSSSWQQPQPSNQQQPQSELPTDACAQALQSFGVPTTEREREQASDGF
jgi:hypothetical protein